MEDITAQTIIDMDDRCEIDTIHENEVARSRLKMPEESLLCELGDFFKTFGDSTRVKIVSALMTGELCVCDIAATLDMTVSAVSHQLRVLRQAKIVRTRRDGKQIFYSIEDHHVGILFTMGLEHIREAK
jgi:ArsR family transcriptional regulator, lead/cadmium/zinc/bismuth-responsive transcriptional repressor